MLIFVPIIMTRKVLINSILPHHYDLLISTDTQNDVFQGRVAIHAQVLHESRIFEINASGLTIKNTYFLTQNENPDSSSLISPDAQSIPYDSLQEIKDYQKLVYNFSEPLKVGKLLVVIFYEGTLSNNMNGFYVSNYGKKMFSTHFEATSARLAFPCFDQPDMKASFEVSLVYPRELTAISNSLPVFVGSPSDNLMSVDGKKDASLLDSKGSEKKGYCNHENDMNDEANPKRYKHLGDISTLLESSSMISDREKRDSKNIPDPKEATHSDKIRDTENKTDPIEMADSKNAKDTENTTDTEKIHSKNINDSNSSVYESIVKQTNDIITSYNNDAFARFDTTPIMSSYLLAFVIGDISFVEKHLNNIRIRVYAPRGEEQLGDFALNVGHDCLNIFTEYFGIDYPLKKLDMVAIPEFAMGAMENWGLITFRKSSLLFDYQTSTISSKKLVAETVCHELAHQWFGNLVTMQWWDDLWLNEGFATWAAALGISKLRKDLIDYDIWTDFLSSDIECGLSADALAKSHPIKVVVNDPEDVEQIFDAISYSKGASLIRMLEQDVGPEVFKNALRKYLKKFSYANAVTNDLWNEISAESGRDIAKMMDLWVSKTGFPLITVEPVNQQDKMDIGNDQNNTKELIKGESKNENTCNGDVKDSVTPLRISQERFYMNNELGSCSKDENIVDERIEAGLWNVPINITFYSSKSDIPPTNDGPTTSPSQNDDIPDDTAGTTLLLDSVFGNTNFTSTTSSLVLEPNEKSATINAPSSLYKFNNEGSGFFRVLYKDSEIITNLLKNHLLNPRDKLSIINDTFQLAISTKIHIKDALKITKHFRNEQNADVMSGILSSLGEIKSIYYDNPTIRQKIEKTILSIIQNPKIDYKMQNKSINQTDLNTYIVDAAVANNHSEITQSLIKMYTENRDINPVFRRSMYVANIKNNTSNCFKDLWEKYKTINQDDIKVSILSALGSTQNDDELQFLLSEFTKNDIKIQDKIYLINSIASNPKYRNKCIEYVMQNFSNIVEIYNQNASLIGYVVERVFGIVSTQDKLSVVSDFLKNLKMKSITRSVDKSVERSVIRTRFRDVTEDFLMNEYSC